MSFDAFVQNRGRALWRTAYMLTGDAHLAEDLVQTTLAKCFPAYDRVGDGFEAYVRKAMSRTYVSWWRRKWNAEVPVAQVPEQTSRDKRQLSIDVLNALSELPKMQRAVVVLRYLDDLSVQEVADLLNISTGTVKSHAHRGCEALRQSPHLQEVSS